MKVTDRDIALLLYEHLLLVKREYCYWIEQRKYYDTKISGSSGLSNESNDGMQQGWATARWECADEVDLAYKEYLQTKRGLEKYRDLVPDIGIFFDDVRSVTVEEGT